MTIIREEDNYSLQLCDVVQEWERSCRDAGVRISNERTKHEVYAVVLYV